jgi:hypothetical protein
MTDLMKLIWPLLDAVEPVFTPFLTARWPNGALERFIELGIVSQMHDADCVVCPYCWDHQEEVIALEGPPGKIRFWIPCPDSLRVEIPPDQLRQWKLNFGAVARQLATSLQLVGEPMQLGSDHLWRLGRGTFEGYLHDVLFARRTDDNGAELLAACSTALRPIVLFAWDVPRHSWWQDRKIPAESLRQIATCTDQGIAADRTQLASLVSHVEARRDANAFRRRGDFWELSFAGTTIYLKDSVGLSYIARLLSEPKRNIPAVSLLALRAGIDPAIPTGSSGEVLDEVARLDYSRRYQELADEVEAATTNNDHGTLEKLQHEMDLLVSELARATGLGGRSRKQSDADRIRKSVSMAVSRDLDRIAQEHAVMGHHLLNSITSGLTFRYSPAGEIFSWLT